MEKIVLRFTYDCDIIAVPKYIATDIIKIRRQFDKWLYDKENDHGYWVFVGGKKRAVSFNSYAFIEYLNKFHISDKKDKAFIVEEKITNVPTDIVILDF